MSAAPFMPLYVADYLADTSHLSASEHGAYLMLIMHYWRQGSLPEDEMMLQRISRMTAREWLRSRDVIAALFNSDWTHDRIDSEIAKCAVKSIARAQSGSRGGHAKALKNKKAHPAKATILPEQKPSEPLASSSDIRHQTEAKASEKRAQTRASFDRFWSAWPNKVGKAAAEAAFFKLDVGEIDAILAGLARYVREKPPDRSWLNPATFLNGRRWNDQPAPTTQSGNFNGKRTVHEAARDLHERIVGEGIVSLGEPPLPFVLARDSEPAEPPPRRLLPQG